MVSLSELIFLYVKFFFIVVSLTRLSVHARFIYYYINNIPTFDLALKQFISSWSTT